MKQFIKRSIYMIVLICLSCLFALLFSFAGTDKFIFFAFFSFISAFLCGIKPMPILLLFFAADCIFFNTYPLYSIQLFLFTLFVCISYRRFSLYTSALLGYALSLIISLILAKLTGNICLAFDKTYIYIISLIFAPPFVFALIRAGFIGKKPKRRYGK